MGMTGNFNGPGPYVVDIPPVSGAGFLLIKGGNDTTPLLRALKPTSDPTGAGDRDAAMEAMLSAQVAGGGRIDIQPGTYYRASLDAGTSNNDPGVAIASGVEINGLGNRGAAVIKIVGGSKCNGFVADGVSDWAIRNIKIDGNRDDPAMPITGGSQDNLRNCIRVKNSSNWVVQGCTLNKASYHGLIGVGAIKNARILDCDTFGNGFRPFHVHDEAGGIPGFIQVRGNFCDSDGQGVFPGLVLTAQIQAGALNKLRVSAADALKLGQIFAAGIATLLVAVPNAGPGGATHFSVATLSAGNPDASLDLTLTLAASQASGLQTCRILAENTSGIFVAYGCTEVDVSNNQIVRQVAQGMDVFGSASGTTARVLVNNNILKANGLGMILGSNNANIVDDLSADGNKVHDSVFEGVVMGTIRNANWGENNDIAGSGLAGLRLVTFGTAQETISIGGHIRRSGAAGIYARGGGVLQNLTITARCDYNGQNALFATQSATTLYGTYNRGFGQGVFVNPDSANKFRSVVIRSPRMIGNENGAAHVNGADYQVIQIDHCVDNVPTAGGAGEQVRTQNGTQNIVRHTQALLVNRTSTDYGISVGGGSAPTLAIMESCGTNHGGGARLYVNGGAGSKAMDCNGTVSYGGAAAAASDAANQRSA